MSTRTTATIPQAGELLRSGAVELARRIREGEVSPVEVVGAHVARLEAAAPALNAVVADRYAAAREEARAAEAALLGGGPVGALHGVPFSVKEMIRVAGMPSTMGDPRRRAHRATSDAVVVRRLREAGAIPLCVTNVPEWGMWFETDNPLYGRTRNPYALDRTPGGSSGGEAAVVGAGGAPFGIGSDIGGSIRIPATFCGVFGHKPTHGLLPLTGHLPVLTDDAEPGRPLRSPFLTLGPLARSAADLMPLLGIMAGPDGFDPNAEPLGLGDPDAVEWRGRTVLLLSDPRILLAARPDPEVREAAVRAARVLESCGARVEPLPERYFRRALDLWTAALRSPGGPTLGASAGMGRWAGVLAELVRAAVGRRRHTLPVTLFALAERIRPFSEPRVRALLEEAGRLAGDLDARLGEGGVLVMPPHPRTAPRHSAPLLRPFDFLYTAILNALRVPVTVAPMGLDPQGLPLGVQVAARRGGDHLTIAAARRLEEAMGGWIPPDLAGPASP